VHPPAADERQRWRQLRQQQIDFAKLELLIGRDEDDQVLGGCGKAGLERAAIAAIREMLDQTEVGNARLKFGARQLASTIATAIVDEDNFIVAIQLLRDVRDFFDGGDDVCFFIIRGQNNG
jgi:hypothetical protein